MFLPSFWPALLKWATVLREKSVTSKAVFPEPPTSRLSRWHFISLLAGTGGCPLHREAGGWTIAACPATAGGSREETRIFFFNHHCLSRAILVVTANPQTKDLSPALVPLGYSPLPPIPGPPVRVTVPLCAASPTMLSPHTSQGEIPCFKKHQFKKKKKKSS